MAAPTELEFTVKMTCQTCVDAVKTALHDQEGIRLTGIDLSTQQVLVETTQPSSRVQELIEQSGRRAALMGMGSTSTAKHLGAAVAMMAGGPVQGVIRMLQTDNDTCLLEGTVDGLQPGPHRVAVHEYGDISDGCNSCGEVLDMMKSVHALEERQGDLGVVEANQAGRAQFRMMTSKLKVWDTIGRSMLLHNTKGIPSENSKVACGIIARSAGVFENAKRICACDGVSVWDERDVPIAGPGRQNKPTAQL